MNDGDEVDNRGLSPSRKMSPGQRLGSPSRYIDPSQWNSFGEEGGLKSPDDPIIPKFDIDPSVPLEPSDADFLDRRFRILIFVQKCLQRLFLRF